MIGINIKELECVVSIAECGSITKAAANMYISPQGLSSLVKKIERELGVTILERSSSGVALNAYGMVLLEKGKGMLETYGELQEEINNLKRLDKGVIRMVSAYGVLRRLTPDFIYEFTQQYPNLHLDYMEFPDHYIDRMVREESADIGFAIGPIEKENFEYHFLYEEDVMLLVREDDALASCDTVSIKEIKDRRFIVESNMFKLPGVFVNKCKQYGFEPNIVFNTSGFSLCHKLCAEGKGISLTLKSNCRDMTNTGLRVIPFEETFKWEIYMITKSGKQIEKNIKQLIEFAKGWEI